jgi:YVTN family beta-propeller protein
MRAMTRLIRCAIPLVLGFICCLPTPSNATYHLLKKVPLGGDGGWDFLSLDPEGRRLYIARSNRVMVVDADSCNLIAEIPNTPGVHGVVPVHKLGRGFTTDAGDTSVTIFDLRTLKVLGHVRTGLRPDAIVFDPASGRIFTMNAGSNDATAIDAAKGTVVGTVPLAGRPEVAVVDGAGRLFVNLEDSSAVQVVDTRSLKAIDRWPLAPGHEPTGLAIDVPGHRLFSVCADSIMVVMDATTGRVIDTQPTGRGTDGCAFDPLTSLVFSSNGVGTLTVVEEIDPGSFRVRENVPTQPGARTLALDDKTHRVFLVTAQFGPPPAPTPQQPHPRRTIVPGSFVLLVFGE